MKLLIVTDAWTPQINGVVRTLTQIRDGLRARGWDVSVLGPTGMTFSCPTYQEIQLTMRPIWAVSKAIEDDTPDFIHIATEGPLGLAMRHYCLLRGWKFTTSFHTRFPEYLKARLSIPRRWTYHYLRRFHEPAVHVLAPSPSIQQELMQKGFRRVQLWGRGVDTELFHPDKREALPFPGPIYLYVGRLAIEKNVTDFLSADLGPGTKLVVGDRPAREQLKQNFPSAVFLGAKHGEELARIYASANVFVFPSRTDTFGLVLLEALASGLPVAAYPVSGPLDVIGKEPVGVLSENLGEATRRALLIDRDRCRSFALNHSWARSINQFAAQLTPKEGFEESIPHLPFHPVESWM